MPLAALFPPPAIPLWSRAMTDAPSSARPLDGVFVLDLSRVLAGPWASLDDAGDGAVTVVEDRPGLEPAGVLSPATARNFHGIKRFSELPHAVRVTFADAADDWNENAQVLVYDDGYSERGEEPGKPETLGTVAATRFESVVIRGLTDRERVRRYWRRRLVANRLRSEEWGCEVWLDHLTFRRGSVMSFTHPTALVGEAWGRIVDFETDGDGDVVAITIDQAHALDVALEYAARVYQIDESQDKVIFLEADLEHPGAGETRRFAFSARPTMARRPSA